MFAQAFSRAARSAACAHARSAFASTSRRDAVRSFGQLADPATFELLQGPEGRVIVDNYDARGFAIKGAYCVGSVFVYDELHAAWSPKTLHEITPETLAALELLEPAPDLLIIGTGKTIGRVNKETEMYLKSLGVALDVSDTASATSTFNVLVEEGRCVAAALLPAGYSDIA